MKLNSFSNTVKLEISFNITLSSEKTKQSKVLNKPLISKKIKIRIKSNKLKVKIKKPTNKGNNLQRQSKDSLRKRKSNSSKPKERNNQKALEDSTIWKRNGYASGNHA